MNKEDSISQSELFFLYAKANLLMQNCISLLVKEYDFLQLSIIRLGTEVATKNNHNKSIYKRKSEFCKDSIKDIPKKPRLQDDSFLCRCMDLQHALVTGDKEEQLNIVKELPLSRIIFEQFIYTWLYNILNYISCNLQFVDAYLDKDISEEQVISLRLFRYENDYGISSNIGYNTIRYIQSHMHAISMIDTRIHNAYTRITLNVAKNQAATEDQILDNYQEGAFGLMRAISSYDYLTNARFPGFARWWIKQAIIFSLKQAASSIKIATNTWQHYTKLEQVKALCESRLGNITNEQLANAAGYTTSHVDNIYRYMRISQLSSLNQPNGEEDSAIIQEKEESLDSSYVTGLLDKLSEEQKRLVCLQYGIEIEQELDTNEVEQEKNRQIAAKSVIT